MTPKKTEPAEKPAETTAPENAPLVEKTEAERVAELEAKLAEAEARNAELEAQAAQKPEPPPEPSEEAKAASSTSEFKETADFVTCRVTKAGDGQISTGEHRAPEGDVKYRYKQKFRAPYSVAMELEGRHFVEIEDGDED